MRVSSNTEVEARQSFAYVSEIKQAITVSSLPVYTSKIQDSQVKTPPFPQDFTRIKIFFQEIALKSNPSLCNANLSDFNYDVHKNIFFCCNKCKISYTAA